MCRVIVKSSNSKGSSKIYYHNEGEYYGWLEFRNANVSEKETELTCYNILKNNVQGIHLPCIKEDTSVTVRLQESAIDTFSKEAKCGYFIQHLDFKEAFKPKMFYSEMMPFKLERYGISEPYEQVVADLKIINENIKKIMHYIGELTLVVTQISKQVYIIDYAKPMGATNDIVPIQKGLNNIISKLGV